MSMLGRNKHIYTAHHASFYVFVLYLVKTSNDFLRHTASNCQYSDKYEVSIIMKSSNIVT